MTLNRQDFTFFQNVHIALSSLAFGVTLSIFLYTYSSGILQNTAHWLLYIATFLLMLRFWYQYMTFYGKELPSHTFSQFLFDFLIAFLGNIAILSVANMAAWTVSMSLALLAASARCKLAKPDADQKHKKQLIAIAKRCVILIVILGLIWFFVTKPFGAVPASMAVFILTVGHLVYTWKKEG